MAQITPSIRLNVATIAAKYWISLVFSNIIVYENEHTKLHRHSLPIPSDTQADVPTIIIARTTMGFVPC